MLSNQNFLNNIINKHIFLGHKLNFKKDLNFKKLKNLIFLFYFLFFILKFNI